MNFFKTVFSDEPNPADPSFAVDDQRHEEESNVRSPNPCPNPSATQTAWSFGGLIKTLASKSESVIETYRRDLEEFGSGLKKETAVIRDVTSRAVKVLPGSLEIGATVARESLESVGQAIDDFGTTVWKETADIISQGKETILAVDQDNDSSLADSSSSNSNNNNNNNQQFSDRGLDLKRYSRFESQLNTIRVDENMYREEPEDLDDYGNWKLGFVVDDESEEIGSLIDENEVMEGIYRKLVPSSIDYESFWSRYFYRVYKLKQAEDARAKLVNRVVAGEEEEEDLTWDFDDDEDDEGNKEKNELASNDEGNKEKNELASNDEGNKEKNELASNDEGNKEKNELASNNELPGNQSFMVNKDGGNGETSSHIENDGKIESIKTENRVSHEVISEGKSDLSEEKTTKTEEKNDNGNSCKDSDFSFVSTQPSVPEEEDLGWDEIEDIGSGDENKMAVSGSIPNIPDLRKRLSAAEEDEDLNWDIEDDDDEPAKK